MYGTGCFCAATSIACSTTGYVTVTPDYSFKVSERLVEEFGNGKVYYGLQKKLKGESINLPTQDTEKPDRDALRWHNNNIYLG